MTRRAARTDRNHAEIRDGLRACGVIVKDTSNVGGGFTDLVAAYRGRVHLIEVKMPGEKLTPAEEKFHGEFADCADCLHVVYSLEDALYAVGVME